VLDFEDFVVVRMLVSGLSLGLGGRQHFHPWFVSPVPATKAWVVALLIANSRVGELTLWTFSPLAIWIAST
jgi:hypothetical protein